MDEPIFVPVETSASGDLLSYLTGKSKKAERRRLERELEDLDRCNCTVS